MIRRKKGKKKQQKNQQQINNSPNEIIKKSPVIMATQLNMATPTINIPIMSSGIIADLMRSSKIYNRDLSRPGQTISSTFMNYNIQQDSPQNSRDYNTNNARSSLRKNNKYGSEFSKSFVSDRKSRADNQIKFRDEKNNKSAIDDKKYFSDIFGVTTFSSTLEVNNSELFDNNNNNNNNNNIYNTTLVNSLWPSRTHHPNVGDYNSNSNNNGTTSISTDYIIIFSTLFFLVGTIGISGNFLVVYIVLSDGKMRRSMTNMMILNLALADSLIMLFGIPEIVMFMMNSGWQLGIVACSVNRTILVCALYASVLTLVAVCIERYIATVFPIKAHILCTKKRVIVVIAFIWLLAGVCSAPTAVFNTIVQMSNTKYCITKFHNNRTKHDIYLRIFKYSELALFYVGPLVIQVVCYAVIGKRLFVDLDKLHRSDSGISSASSRPSFRGPTRAFNEAMRARKGVVKMLMASVAIYFLSYSPHQILLIYNTFSSLEFDETWMYLVFTTTLAYVNSAANPFLYCVFSDNFRSNFKRIMRRCLPCEFCCCTCCGSCSSCLSCKDQKTQRPMTMHSYTEYTSLVRRNTHKQNQSPIIAI